MQAIKIKSNWKGIGAIITGVAMTTATGCYIKFSYPDYRAKPSSMFYDRVQASKKALVLVQDELRKDIEEKRNIPAEWDAAYVKDVCERFPLATCQKCTGLFTENYETIVEGVKNNKKPNIDWMTFAAREEFLPFIGRGTVGEKIRNNEPLDEEF
mmetsp:Transcript_2828/g.4076  ORF Transcript_2828/g.4076 Transcript_2828/m.4076 type:complete len:155 (+) Transcript_2828:45-509(+)|eukprot:CAMPEP_0117430088 /NCGR_PEP_ID=MMETSP0758-20121206/9603_1 /TAXON_ID=63605 /ORGANISM="Percolomonas cosmopolitus, Strain AE-1 (ATCC 50343)" /LENGTH=154 /DNA_ID=CAMNT_0005217709 /DNA_START=8 /DNA_END=472 /DNA_ORIENTATION=-